MSPDVEQILQAAILAPSGENCQPWRFVVKGDTIELWCRPERDRSPYNWGQRGTYMATGAALENLSLAAQARGYAADIAYFPGTEYHVATITLTRDEEKGSDPLADFIAKRVSNRKPYRADALTSETIAALQRAADESGYGHLKIVTERKGIEALAKIGSVNEGTMLANDSLHAFFFDHVSWTKAEDDRKKMGFFIDTLELPPPARLAFRLIRRPRIMRILRRLGFPKAVAAQNAATYAAAGAIGIISGEGTTPLDFVRAGRALERIWLTATAQGLSMQPLAGTLFLALSLQAGETAGLADTDIKAITEASKELSRIADTEKPVLFMFRIGRSEPPTARASRFPLADSVEIRSI